MSIQIIVRNRLIQSIRIANWIGISITTFLGWFILQTNFEKYLLFALVVSAAGFNQFVIPFFPRNAIVSNSFVHMAIGSAIVILAGFALLFAPYGYSLEVVFILIICIAGMIAGTRVAILSTIIISIVYIPIISLFPLPTTYRSAEIVFHIMILLVVGYWTSRLSGSLNDHLKQSARKNFYLSLLLKVGMIASQRAELGSILSQICNTIVSDLPATWCQILLLDPTRTKLIVYGDSLLRSTVDRQPKIGEPLSLDYLPQVQRLFETGQYLLFDQAELDTQEAAEIVNRFAFEGVKTLGLFPLTTKGDCLGLVSLAEIRSWQREPFTNEKTELLQTLATQIASVIESAHLFAEAQDRAERLEVLNEVGKAIGSTIELKALLELIHIQLNRVIPTDTYFVALFDPVEDELDFRILIDNEITYPPKRIPLGEGLSSWVIKNRAPLLIRRLSQESDRLPIRPIVMGKDQISESWLGVPMLAGERALGILAVASYSPDAFEEQDLTLLTSIASQAAIALDNAGQHEAVKEQARHDSLTGALNHGAFLASLDQALEIASAQSAPVSMIMIDVDHLKDYNDRFGHLMGDEVLVRIVEETQALLPSTGFIGRWGGEEFSIGLPGVSVEEAKEIANQICAAMLKIVVTSRNGESAPIPTVSQGIAAFPIHARNREELIDLADAALYRAKNTGRGRVLLTTDRGHPPLEIDRQAQ